MMMKMLDAAGLEIVTDRIRTADEDNPKGYFELERVKDLDKEGDKSWMSEHRGKVVKIISFLLKDLPDHCYYKVIFMRRELEEVLASQNKMLVRRGESTDSADDEKMMRLYANHLGKVELMMEGQLNLEFLDVRFRDTVDDARAQAVRVCEFLGLPDHADTMAEAVDRKLYRNRK